MPTVPRLDRPQVSTNPRPQVRTSPLAAGGALAVGLGSLAETANDIGQTLERERVRALDVRMNAAEVQARDLRNRILSDPKKGILNRRGEQAFTASEDAATEWMTGVSAIEQNIADPEARLVFRQRMDILRSEMDATVNRHVAGEFDAVDAVNTKALVESALVSIQQSAADPAQVGVDIHRATQALDGRLTRQGVPEQARDVELARLTSKLRTEHITTLADAGDIDAATEAFETHGADVQGDDRQRVERALQDGGVKVKSAAEESRILTQHPTDKAAALAEARKIENVGVRDATINRLMATFSQNEAMEREANGDLGDKLFGQLERSGGNLSALNPSDWAKAADVRGLRQALEARSSQIIRGDAPETDWELWTTIREMTPAQRRNANPTTDWMPYLSPAMYKQALDLRARNSEAPTSDADVDRSLLAQSIALGLLPTSVRNPRALKGPSGARYEALRLRVTEQLDRDRSAKGGNLSPPEVEAAMRSVLDDVVLQERFWGSDRVIPRAFARPDDDVRDLTPEEKRTRRAERWDAYVLGGMSEAEATAKVNREIP